MYLMWEEILILKINFSMYTKLYFRGGQYFFPYFSNNSRTNIDPEDKLCFHELKKIENQKHIGM